MHSVQFIFSTFNKIVHIPLYFQHCIPNDDEVRVIYVLQKVEVAVVVPVVLIKAIPVALLVNSKNYKNTQPIFFQGGS